MCKCSFSRGPNHERHATAKWARSGFCDMLDDGGVSMRSDTLHGIRTSRMTSFHEIPDYLKSDDRETWTLAQGLFWGAAAVISAAVFMGAALYWITYRAPFLTMHWPLSLATTFFMTWVLFAIMQRVSGVIHRLAITIIAVAMIAVVMAKYFACLAIAEDAPPLMAGEWRTMTWATFMFWSIPAWIGLVLATLACRNGKISFEDILETVTFRH